MTDDRRKMLEDLRDRLGKATGPKWVLDIALECALCGAAEVAGEYPKNIRAVYKVSKDGRLYNPPNYTASIDAAVMLVPRNTNWILAVHSDEGIAATFSAPSDISIGEFAATPALALCLARIEYELSQLPEDHP